MRMQFTQNDGLLKHYQLKVNCSLADHNYCDGTFVINAELIKTAIGCGSTTVKAFFYKDAKTDLTTDDLRRLSYPFETEKTLLYLNDKVLGNACTTIITNFHVFLH